MQFSAHGQAAQRFSSSLESVGGAVTVPELPENHMRRHKLLRRMVLAVGVVVGLATPLSAQTSDSAAKADRRNPFVNDPEASRQGALLFRQECMFCHGIGAQGGMRGPDLTTGSWNHGGADAALFAR
jgi:mono/diheme cytochrome c family protein